MHTMHIYIYGYESKPWYPSEPQITGEWMFIPPNIARLVLIHPHIYILHCAKNITLFFDITYAYLFFFNM